jgi:hypothetical protein
MGMASRPDLDSGRHLFHRMGPGLLQLRGGHAQ